jgi:hypothetical protein
VQPVSDISKLRSPLDGLRTPTDVEAFLNGMIEGQPTPALENNSDPSQRQFPQNQLPKAIDASRDSLAEVGGLAGRYGHTLN